MKNSIKGAIAICLVALLAQGCNMLRGQSTPSQYADDVAITAKVKSELLDSTKVDGLDVNVNSRNGAVTLTGWATTQTEKSKATALARAVSGVKSVNNQLAIKK